MGLSEILDLDYLSFMALVEIDARIKARQRLQDITMLRMTQHVDKEPYKSYIRGIEKETRTGLEEVPDWDRITRDAQQQEAERASVRPVPNR
jgi:hypothetical protein